MLGRPGFATRRLRSFGAACALAMIALWSRAAVADETITDFAGDFGVAGRFTAGVETGPDLELVLSIEMLRVSEHRYRGYGMELSYVGNDTLEFFGFMPRIEFGLGGPRFNRRTPGSGAHAWVPYIAVTAGYGSGAVWDTEYIELYGTEEAVEVTISGVPMYAALGLRRIGGFSLRLEAVGGMILVTSEEAERPEGDAPSFIPSLGVRFAFGGDTFSYVWM